MTRRPLNPTLTCDGSAAVSRLGRPAQANCSGEPDEEATQCQQGTCDAELPVRSRIALPGHSAQRLPRGMVLAHVHRWGRGGPLCDGFIRRRGR